MTRKTCHGCHQPIPGPAVLRGNGVELRAWHKDCAELDGIMVATLRDTVARHIGPLQDVTVINDREEWRP